MAPLDRFFRKKLAEPHAYGGMEEQWKALEALLNEKDRRQFWHRTLIGGLILCVVFAFLLFFILTDQFALPDDEAASRQEEVAEQRLSAEQQVSFNQKEQGGKVLYLRNQQEDTTQEDVSPKVGVESDFADFYSVVPAADGSTVSSLKEASGGMSDTSFAFRQMEQGFGRSVEMDAKKDEHTSVLARSLTEEITTEAIASEKENKQRFLVFLNRGLLYLPEYERVLHVTGASESLLIKPLRKLYLGVGEEASLAFLGSKSVLPGMGVYAFAERQLADRLALRLRLGVAMQGLSDEKYFVSKQESYGVGLYRKDYWVQGRGAWLLQVGLGGVWRFAPRQAFCLELRPYLLAGLSGRLYEREYPLTEETLTEAELLAFEAVLQTYYAEQEVGEKPRFYRENELASGRLPLEGWQSYGLEVYWAWRFHSRSRLNAGLYIAHRLSFSGNGLRPVLPAYRLGVFFEW